MNILNLRDCPSSFTIDDILQNLGQLQAGSIDRIILPDNAKIPGYAFKDYKSLQEIWYIESAESIGDYAFSGCSSLNDKILLNSNGCTIGKHAFENCSNLKEIWYLEKANHISDYAFAGCESLQYAYCSNADYIGDHAFSKCKNINSIIIDSAESIGDYAFSGCSSLNDKILLNSNGCTIGKHAFENCSNLKEIWYLEKANHISDYAFAGCESLQYAYCSNADYIGLNAFERNDRLFDSDNTDIFQLKPTVTKHIISENPLQIKYYAGDSDPYPGNTLTLSKNVTAKSVQEACNAFGISQSNVFDIEFTEPDTVIGREAFKSFTALSSIINPENIAKIGNDAFAYCESLSGLSAKNCTEIGRYAFRGCKNLESLIAPNCTFVDYNAFYDTKLWDVEPS